MPFDERLLNGMGVLSAIVDCGTFAAAVERLDMTQSGVSRAVARLEGRLGIRLFDRTTRSVRLTDEGRRLYEQIAPLLAGLEEAASSVSGSVSTVRGRLRVNVDPFFSRLVLGPRLGKFVERYPELQLEIVTRDQLGDMIADGYDLGLRFGEPPASTLIARKLFDTRILTVAAPSYLERHGRPATPQALKADLEVGRHICVHFRDSLSGRPFPWEFHRGAERVVIAPTAATGRITLNDAGTLYSVCIAGYAMAQVMGLGVEPMLADGTLIDLFPEWGDERFPLYAMYPSRHHPPAKVRAFLEFVTSVTATNV
jgi:DNA-binding transcriptional LysR family regulator